MLIASAPHRENVYLEIWYKEEMIIEITNEDNGLEVIFYVTQDPWKVDYKILMETLEKGKNHLLGVY